MLSISGIEGVQVGPRNKELGSAGGAKVMKCRVLGSHPGPRRGASLTRNANSTEEGPILLVGGEDFDGNLTQTTNVSSTWLYDPNTKLWRSYTFEDEVEYKIKRSSYSHPAVLVLQGSLRGQHPRKEALTLT